MLVDDYVPLILLAALVFDAMIGDPDWLWRRLPHPVAIMGGLIAALERSLNHNDASDIARRRAGLLAMLAAVAAAIAIGLLLTYAVDLVPVLVIVETIAVTVLIAQNSLHQHVNRVRVAFAQDGLDGARKAVAMIVGRDPAALDEAGVCRAAIESTAENFSDGVVAPAFWYLVAGLPGILAYKMINTADSMIGHRTERHEAFGRAAARLDDFANLIPARLSALLLALAAPLVGGTIATAAHTAWRDAHLHKSPNAGWQEAAAAGALGLALAGPRTYAGATVDDPWLNADGRRDAQPADIAEALRLLIAACVVHGTAVAVIVAIVILR